MEWWINSSGVNLLKGVYDSLDNPIVLADEAIVEFLMEINAARDSFNRIVPTMLPEEQARLMHITEGMPQLKALVYDRVSDAFQHRLNTQRIRTSGPHGGGN